MESGKTDNIPGETAAPTFAEGLSMHTLTSGTVVAVTLERFTVRLCSQCAARADA